MSSTIYCTRCDSHVSIAMRSFHEQACGPAVEQLPDDEPLGYDPYNSVEGKPRELQFNGRDDHRSNDFNLPMLLRRQAS